MKKFSALCGLVLAVFVLVAGYNEQSRVENVVPFSDKVNEEVTHLSEGEETKWVKTSSVDNSSQTIEIPMVMVNGKLYYNTGKESILDGRCGTMDGEITSTVKSYEIPTEDNQSNFGIGYGYQYATNKIIEVYMVDGEKDNYKWIIFEQINSEKDIIQFHDRWINKANLSEKTIEWLERYNELSKEEQLSISSIPPELLEDTGIIKIEDSEADTQK